MAWDGMRRQLGEIALEFPIIPFLAFHCPIRAAAATNIPFVVSRQTLPRNMLHMFGTASLFTFFGGVLCSIVPRSAAVFVQFCDNFTFLEFPSRRVWLDLKHRKKRRAKHFSRRTALARSLGRWCREGLVWGRDQGEKPPRHHPHRRTLLRRHRSAVRILTHSLNTLPQKQICHRFSEFSASISAALVWLFVRATHLRKNPFSRPLAVCSGVAPSISREFA